MYKKANYTAPIYETDLFQMRGNESNLNHLQLNLLSTSNKNFLAHRIEISEIFPWDRKSNLTHAILPRLSCEGFIHWLYWNSRTWSSSDVGVMLK